MKYKTVVGLDSETYTKDRKTYPFLLQLYTEDEGIAKYCGKKVGNKYVYADIFEVFREEELRRFVNLISTKKFRDSLFVVFNMSFDLSVLSLLGLKVKAVYNARFISGSIEISKHNIKVLDLRNIIPSLSLYELGKMIGLEKLQHPIHLGTEKSLELYLTNEEYREYFRRYALRDAEICYKAFKKIMSKIKNIKNLGFTAGSTSVKYYANNYNRIRFPRYPEEVVEKLRKAYRGGRTEVFARGTIPEAVKYYDINSLYPFVMYSNRFPFITNSSVGRFIKKNNINLDFEGIALVKISVDSDLPPLGVKRKVEDGFTKLIFPSGVVVDWFTYPELRKVEELGGKILNVYEAFEWKVWCYPFREFIEDMYRKRLENKDNKLFYTMYKMLMNSLYGKFGEYKPSKSITLINGIPTRTEELNKRHAFYHSVVYASYITAYGRLTLYDFLRKVNLKNLYYCDTDSLFVSESLDSYVGSELGKLKKEGEVSKNEATFIRSKFYIFKDLVRLKGFVLEDSGIVKTLLRVNKNEVVQKMILKPLEAKRRGKEVLSEVVVRKVFNTAPDYKRRYLKDIDGSELLEDFTYSESLEVREGGLDAYNT